MEKFYFLSNSIQQMKCVSHDTLQTEQFIVQSLHSTLASDSLLSSHPLTADVESPDEIQAIFDSITYNKVRIHAYHLFFQTYVV